MSPRLGVTVNEKPITPAPLRSSSHVASIDLPANFLTHQPPCHRTRALTAFARRITAGVYRACRTEGIGHARTDYFSQNGCGEYRCRANGETHSL